MKKTVTLIAGLLFAGSVIAGSLGGHDGDKIHASGGCDSKAKIEAWKKIHGKDFFVQTPEKSDVKKSETPEKTRVIPLDRFI